MSATEAKKKKEFFLDYNLQLKTNNKYFGLFLSVLLYNCCLSFLFFAIIFSSLNLTFPKKKIFQPCDQHLYACFFSLFFFLMFGEKSESIIWMDELLCKNYSHNLERKKKYGKWMNKQKNCMNAINTLIQVNFSSFSTFITATGRGLRSEGEGRRIGKVSSQRFISSVVCHLFCSQPKKYSGFSTDFFFRLFPNTSSLSSFSKFSTIFH